LGDGRSGHQGEAAEVLTNIGYNQPDVIIPALMLAYKSSSQVVTNQPRGIWELRRVPPDAAVLSALGSVGNKRRVNVIPFLTNLLLSSDTKIVARGAMASALVRVAGYEADTFVPVLTSALTNGDASASDRDAIAISLANVGRHQPDSILPSLILAFTNSSVAAQPGIAAALASLGNDAHLAIPVLLQAGESSDWKLRAESALAVKKIAPQTRHALAPLTRNLAEADPNARNQALMNLENLGTNAMEALPALAKSLASTNAQMRTDTARCIARVGEFSEEIISALGENLAFTNKFTAGAAWEALAQFAPRSKSAFVMLMQKSYSLSTDLDARQQCRYTVLLLSREDPSFLLEELESPDPDARHIALRILDQLERYVPASIPKLRRLIDNEADEDFRKLAKRVLEAQARMPQ
jgi:hypothetical protein